MRRVVFASLLLVMLAVAFQVVEACGDKFLLVGRGRFQRAYAALYPGTIVIYTHAQTPVTSAIRDQRFQTTLARAGHSVAVADDRGRLEQALRSNAIDIVLADVVEAPALDRLAATAPSKPTVLYVAYDLDKADLKRLQAQYNCPLKTGDKANRYLMVIDDQMKARGSSRQPRKGR
jgi:hypothetical protein